MKCHFLHLKHLLRHKWFVLQAGLKLKVPLHLLIFHDFSKFGPREWSGYAERYFGSGSYEKYQQAWLHHTQVNKHHWQYWCLCRVTGAQEAFHMPERYIREMTADWAGAGRAITGEWRVKQWYEDNKDSILIHPLTRERVETLLEEF